MRRVAGYIISTIPLIGSLAIVVNYAFFITQPIEPPNQTLQGTEIFIPVGLGVLLALIFGLQILLRKREVRKDLVVWTSLSIAPFILLLLFLYVPH